MFDKKDFNLFCPYIFVSRTESDEYSFTQEEDNVVWIHRHHRYESSRASLIEKSCFKSLKKSVFILFFCSVTLSWSYLTITEWWSSTDSMYRYLVLKSKLNSTDTINCLNDIRLLPLPSGPIQILTIWEKALVSKEHNGLIEDVLR